MFYSGQKVVCVNDWPEPGRVWGLDEAPRKGAVYTVTNILIHEDGNLVLWLAEIHRDEGARKLWGSNVGYGAFRFRPITERKTDISIFQRILDNPELEIVS